MRLFAALIALCAFGTLVGIGLGFLGSIHPAFDTFSHFRFHFAFCLLIAFIVLAIGTRCGFLDSVCHPGLLIVGRGKARVLEVSAVLGHSAAGGLGEQAADTEPESKATELGWR